MGVTPPAEPTVVKAARLTSLDAYRGFIMLAMASSGFAIPKVAEGFRGHPVWDFLAFQFEHVAWTGCSFWDLIQPSFMFMVGVAMPFSYASRVARGDTPSQIRLHTIVRSLVLVALGVFLSSNRSVQTHFTFVNVLSQIGLGYTFVFLLLGRGLALQLLAAAAILGGYWYFFYQFPAPGPDFDFKAVGVPAGFETFTGLFAHWNKNANAASAFDLWFLNLFPQVVPFQFNAGGYQTLNFIPSMATMLFGLIAGELLRRQLPPRQQFAWLVLAGCVLLAGGWYAAQTICPSVKRIWTPTWAIYSTGWTCLMLAGFFWLIDVQGWKGWAFPLSVVGMNSIAMYCMAQLLKPWTEQTLKTHFGQNIFDGTYGPIIASVSVLFAWWLVCYWMYRQKIFVRI